MNLKEFIFINEESLLTGINVSFKELETPSGSIMTFTTPDDKKFIIKTSLENFNRFEKWDGKNAKADVLPLKKKVKTKDGEYTLAKIRTDVKIDGEKKTEEKGEVVF